MNQDSAWPRVHHTITPTWWASLCVIWLVHVCYLVHNRSHSFCKWLKLAEHMDVSLTNLTSHKLAVRVTQSAVKIGRSESFAHEPYLISQANFIPTFSSSCALSLNFWTWVSGGVSSENQVCNPYFCASLRGGKVLILLTSLGVNFS